VGIQAAPGPPRARPDHRGRAAILPPTWGRRRRRGPRQGERDAPARARRPGSSLRRCERHWRPANPPDP